MRTWYKTVVAIHGDGPIFADFAAHRPGGQSP